MIAVFLLLPAAESGQTTTNARAPPLRASEEVHDRNMFTPLSPRHSAHITALAVLALCTLTGAATGFGSVDRSTAPLAVSASWTWPVPAPHPIVQPFIAPETQYSAGHRGIDIAAPADSIVRSPADGVIHFSGFVVNRSLVSIDHGGGILSSFEPVHSDLAEGTLVRRGEQIGVLQSGHCSTPCLHLGVRVQGRYVSPLNYLGTLAPSVLLPTRPI